MITEKAAKQMVKEKGLRLVKQFVYYIADKDGAPLSAEFDLIDIECALEDALNRRGYDE